MLGYIVPDKPELKIREYEIYSGYYCGICRSIGKRHGQIPRVSLSYDSVFLALIAAGLDDTREILKIDRCIVHPLKKRPIIEKSMAVDFAADMHLLMFYHKLQDDRLDGSNLLATAGVGFMSGIYKKLKKRYPDISSKISNQLELLSELEKKRTPSLDQAAEPYARAMEAVFRGVAISESDSEEVDREVLAAIGFNLGKWVYTIDAFDDLDDDIKNDNYNPLLVQFEYNSESGETAGAFRARIDGRIEFSLIYCLAELAKAFASLNIKHNKELIENIVYFGLHRKTEEVLKKGRTNGNAESI